MFRCARVYHWCVLLAITLMLPLDAFADQIHASKVSDRPISFAVNRGQWPDSVRFQAVANGATLWFTNHAVYYQFTRIKPNARAFDPASAQFGEARELETEMIRADFLGSNSNQLITGDGLLEYKCNYFLGNDSTRWRSDVPNYQSITYKNIYEGIDLHFRSTGKQLEYDLIVAPGADVNQIRVRYDRNRSLSINPAGELVISAEWCRITESLPQAFQETSHGRRDASVGFEIVDASTIGFRVNSEFDRSQALVIDPVLIFSGYLGGSGQDDGQDLVVSSSGEVIICGHTASSNFPTLNAYDNTINSGRDAFVTKFSAAGNSLIFSTFLGGDGQEYCWAVATTTSSSYGICLTGYTESSNFPMASALDASLGGTSDAFVATFNSSGNSLSFSTYLGGASLDDGYDIAALCVPPCFVLNIRIWVTGKTFSSDFPIVSAFDVSHNGGGDGFLSQIRISGILPVTPTLLYSTFFGGSGLDYGQSIDVTASSPFKPYIVGSTTSSNLPVVGAFDASIGGSSDMFVAGFDVSGGGDVFPIASTYFGGDEIEFPQKVILNDLGQVIVGGRSNSTGLATAGAYDTAGDNAGDVVVAIFNSSLNGLQHCTYLGGASQQQVYGIALDNDNNPCIAGSTAGSFPIVNPLAGSPLSGSSFIAKLNPSLSDLQFSSFIGGTYPSGVGVDPAGCIYVGGTAYSSDIQLVNPYDASFGGISESYLMKICGPYYTCGDADNSGAVTISDAVLLINYIFAGGPAPVPLIAGDADCSGGDTISDAVYLINYIFGGGTAPCAACP